MASRPQRNDRESPPIAEWFPDWAPQPGTSRARNTNDHLQPARPTTDPNDIRLSDVSRGDTTTGSETQCVEDARPVEADENGQAKEEDPSSLPADEWVVETSQDRAVNRHLGGIHIFMITISGVLGVGLYVRGGTILRLGGPIAVLLSFALLGALAWGVMQCIAEMLCIWPISGALQVYVSRFVDPELGTVVGVAYWYTYAISFTALVAASAGIAEYWETPKGIQGGVLFFLIPAVLVLVNAFGIQLFGLVEVIGGTLKLSFLAVIIVTMIAINQGAGSGPKIGTSLYPTTVIVRDKGVTSSWAQAFFMSLSIAAFAYVGVEIAAASALEARVTKDPAPQNSRTIGRAVKFSAVWIPFLAGLVYVLAGVLVTLNIEWDNPNLPRMSWVTGPASADGIGSTASAFVLVAEKSLVPGLAGTLNVFLMFTCLSCANTNLYVASRTLFSLTRHLDGGPSQPWYTRAIAYFGRTNHRKVPLAAILVSCIFVWIPFLYLASEHGPDTSIGTILDILSEMGSIGVVIVWTCECWAYIRFHGCVQRSREALLEVPYVRRWNRGKNNMPDDFPYRSHGQPMTAYASLIACLIILFVANGASLWKEFRWQQFLAAYLAPICFLILWLVLKIVRRGQWRLVDLSNGDELAKKMLQLHEIRWRSADGSQISTRGIQNLWGLL